MVLRRRYLIPMSDLTQKTRSTQASVAAAMHETREQRDCRLLDELNISASLLPTITQRLNAITTKLVGDFIKADFSAMPSGERERLREYQAILRASDLRAYVADNLAVNASTLVRAEIVLVHHGLLRTLAQHPDFNNWDSIACVLAHEISHTLYERSKLLSVSEKASRLGALDMENQCDRDAMLLMDVAGFNIRFADLSFLNDVASSPSTDAGVLSTHPHPHVRNAELESIRNENYWSNYSERSVNTFSQVEIAEIEGPTKLELALSRSESAQGEYVPGDRLQNLLVLFLGVTEGDASGARRDLLGHISDNPRDDVPLLEAVGTLEVALQSRRNQEEFFRQAMELELSHPVAVRHRRFVSTHISPSELLRCLDCLPSTSELASLSAIGSQSLRVAVDDFYRQVKLLTAETILVNASCGNEVTLLLSRAYNVFGSGCLRVPDLGMLPEVSPQSIPGMLQELGSERLVLNYYRSEPQARAAALLGNDFCREVLQTHLSDLVRDSHYPPEHLTMAQVRKILYSREEFPEESLQRFVQNAVSSRMVTSPLDLLQAFTVLQGSRRADIVAHFVKLEIASIRSPAQQSQVRKFWEEKFLAAGHLLFSPDKPSPEQAREILASLGTNNERSQDWQTLARAINASLTDAFEIKSRACVGDNRTPTIEHTEVLRSKAPRGGIGDFWRFGLSASDHSDTFDQGYHTAIAFPVPWGLRNPSDGVAAGGRQPPAQIPPLPAGTEIAADYLVAVARHGSVRALGELVRINYFDTLEKTSAFWCDCSSFTILRDDGIISKSLVTDFIGPTIEARDFVFYQYLHKTAFAEIKYLSLQETVTWMNQYMPRKGVFRDLILTTVWFERFKEEGGRYTAQEAFAFLELFTDTSHRRELFARQVYTSLSPNYTTLEDACRFIRDVFPAASVARDGLFEAVLRTTDFRPSQFIREVAPHLSAASRQYARAESIFDGTLGSAVDMWSHVQKREVAEWLFLSAPKPRVIRDLEQTSRVRFDELVVMSAEPSARAEMVKKLFLGARGLASSSEVTELEVLLDYFFAVAFERAETARNHMSSIEIFHMSSIEIFVRECIKTTIAESGIFRREALINRLIELASITPKLSPEGFIAHWLAGHSPAMIKGLQILSSRPEVREAYPALYEAAKECKSSAPTMTVLDTMKAVLRNRAVREADPVIQSRLGAASIKSVHRALFSDGLRALKVRHVTADKDTEQSSGEIARIYQKMKPLLTELFGISSFPQINRRVESAVKSELDFSAEVRNAQALKHLLSEAGYGDSVKTPTIDLPYCDENIIVEELADGVELEHYISANPRSESTLAGRNQRMFLQLLRKGVVLADLHQGNQFIDGRGAITVIDTGSVFFLDKHDTRNLLRIAAGLVSPVYPERFIIAALTDIMGDDFRKNEVLLRREVASLGKLPSAQRVPALLRIVEQVPDYHLPDSMYWSIVGLAKPFGLDRFQFSNIPEYAALLAGTL